MESVFNIKLCRSLFLVKLQGFPINDSQRVRGGVGDGVCFQLQLFMLQLFSNVQEITINGSEGACDGVCFQLQAVTETVFDESPCFSYNWQ